MAQPRRAIWRWLRGEHGATINTMITVNVNPMLFSLGHFGLRWYGLIVAIAIAVGVWVALREARRKGLSDSQFADAIP